MRQLIVNADDYGLDQNINEGIIYAFSSGIVTSTTVLANGEAFSQGIAALKKHPGLGVGVHLTLVNGHPLSSLAEIPTLVTEKGVFWANYGEFFRLFLVGKINLAEIKKEWTAQILKVKEQGLEITHLDSHQHLHIFPGIVDIVVDLAQEFGINKVRLPREEIWFLGGGVPSWGRFLSRALLTIVANLSQQKIIRQGIITSQHFYGMLWGGQLKEEKLASILEQLPLGVSELMTHPGLNNSALNQRFSWGYHWEEEVKSLTSPEIKAKLEEKKIRLISYGDLGNE